jgi:hypothetical protein
MTKTALAESAENCRSREHVHGGFLVGEIVLTWFGPNLSTLDEVLLKTHHSVH